MARRRNTTPPFEIMNALGAGRREGREAEGGSWWPPRMRTRSSGPENKRTDDERDPAPAQDEAWDEGGTGAGSGGTGEGAPWWAPGVPVVVRLPRGMAVVLGVGMLGLILLAYWVGHARGVSAAQAGEPGAAQAVAIRVKGPPGSAVGSNGTEKGGRPLTGTNGKIGGDTRKAGFNYLVLARRRIDDARRLARWLEDQGVDVAIVPSDNPDLFQVISMRGFTSETWNGKKGDAFMDRLHRLGRRWKTHNGGKGGDLADMWWMRYNAQD